MSEDLGMCRIQDIQHFWNYWKHFGSVHPYVENRHIAKPRIYALRYPIYNSKQPLTTFFNRPANQKNIHQECACKTRQNIPEKMRSMDELFPGDVVNIGLIQPNFTTVVQPWIPKRLDDWKGTKNE